MTDGDMAAANAALHAPVKAHTCRPEPHCVCGENAWYHRDTDEDGVGPAAECGMEGCACQEYTRCNEYGKETNPAAN